ncbi:serine/threonine-protein kinase PLK4-like isoform X2 [Mizuhopecten yessoensis]|uniref:Serine/threonine-protein kinase PLK4 n=1 Tax=Mizuhopecten yessoensis TaxID=6573 RepID=A0A210QYV0_MIZYE|nr:serine/threonine-protein kinase PLK4-like isoform X2 [Mizuhopecten yessoensis]OWF53904.1 Serine/threonine-protein kinase PLK4 [Mizuhopecten yessoensis]
MKYTSSFVDSWYCESPYQVMSPRDIYALDDVCVEKMREESLQDYQVLNLLGKGGFACVYRARAIKTGLEVAIKMIDKKLMKAAGMVARVKKEVEIHSRLKHPSILELYNYFEDNNYVYLVLEISHNGELNRYLKANCKVLTEAEAQHFMRQIVKGMLYLHSHGILHRDLTLANLLLTRNMDVKIADFGLATQLNIPDEKHFTMCGTPNYISPEIAMRSAHGLESDVWSLGCMLYTFLVGRPPFDTEGVKTTLNRVILAEFHLPDHISNEAKDLIQSLLKKNPKERQNLKDILTHPFMMKDNSNSLSKGSQGFGETSIDSGRGTMATISSSRVSSHPKPRPFPAFPLGSQISEDEESLEAAKKQGAEQNEVFFPRKGVPPPSNPILRHPPSPPVRLRDSDKEARLGSQRSTDRYMRTNSQDKSQELYGAPTFDPTKYQETTPNSSTGWSCSLSTHSNDPRGRFSPPQLSDSSKPSISSALSDLSSQEGTEFSLQNTKKLLNFDGDAMGSWHERCPQPDHKTGQRYQDSHGHSMEDMLSSNRYQNTDIKTVHNSAKASSSSKSIRDVVSPLNSSRLRHIRQRTRNAIVNILECGDVCLEFLKQKQKVEKVVEVFLISVDGQTVNIYQPNNGRGEPVCDVPVTLPPVPSKSYTFDTLPEKYWKKYQYAARFVKLVRSKTPKVTLFTSRSKCMLMENSPDADFESIFYDGAKFTINSTNTRIIEKSGTSLVLDSAAAEERLTEDTQRLLVYVKQCRHQCLEIESVISAVQQRCALKTQFFPIIIGSRPKNQNLNDSGRSTSTSGTGPSSGAFENMSSPSSGSRPSPSVMTSFDGTVVSTMTDCVDQSVDDSQDRTLKSEAVRLSAERLGIERHNGGAERQGTGTERGANTSPTSSHSGGSQLRKGGHDITRQVYVPDVGIASQLTNGEIWVKFNDGTQLGVRSTTTTIKFVDTQGKLFRFQKTDILPELVKSRLGKVPVVLEHLLQQERSVVGHNNAR